MNKIFFLGFFFIAGSFVFASHTPEHVANTRNYLDFVNNGVAQYLYDNGITKITPAKTNFEGKLKRWHVAILLKRLFKDYKQLPALAGDRNCDFEDINTLAGDDQSELIEACMFGVMQGSQGKFRPNDEILREHVYIILARLTSNDGSIDNLDDALKILDEKRLAVDGKGARGVSVYPIERGQVYQHIMDVLYRIYKDKKIIELYKAGSVVFPDK